MRKLEDISRIRGLGPSLLFAVDSKSEPGKVICHFVRFETIEFENDDNFDETTFKMIHADNDARLDVLHQCFLGK
jgi:hypothetical protein